MSTAGRRRSSRPPVRPTSPGSSASLAPPGPSSRCAPGGTAPPGTARPRAASSSTFASCAASRSTSSTERPGRRAGSPPSSLTQATAAHGLAVGLGDTGSVGVAGITLGGGIGYLVRKHGLTIEFAAGGGDRDGRRRAPSDRRPAANPICSGRSARRRELRGGHAVPVPPAGRVERLGRALVCRRRRPSSRGSSRRPRRRRRSSRRSPTSRSCLLAVLASRAARKARHHRLPRPRRRSRRGCARGRPVPRARAADRRHAEAHVVSGAYPPSRQGSTRTRCSARCSWTGSIWLPRERSCGSSSVPTPPSERRSCACLGARWRAFRRKRPRSRTGAAGSWRCSPPSTTGRPRTARAISPGSRRSPGDRAGGPRRVRQLPHGRGRRARPRGLSGADLGPARGGQAALRPDEPLPVEPEHPAGGVRSPAARPRASWMSHPRPRYRS